MSRDLPERPRKELLVVCFEAVQSSAVHGAEIDQFALRLSGSNGDLTVHPGIHPSFYRDSIRLVT